MSLNELILRHLARNLGLSPSGRKLKSSDDEVVLGTYCVSWQNRKEFPWDGAAKTLH